MDYSSYQFTEQQRDDKITELDAFLGAEVKSGKTLSQVIADAITAGIAAACGESGAITTAIGSAITAACGENGAITNAISSAITAACGENGAVTTAISTAITTAIGENGSIETWADGRYEPKSE